MPPFNVALAADAAKQKFASKAIPPAANRQKLTDFIAAAASAIGGAVTQWQSLATLNGVVINGPVAVGGRFAAPAITPFIMQRFQSGFEPLASIAAAGVRSAMDTITANVKVPGLPWYPSFAAMGMPFAPPTPNIPTPLLVLVGGGVKPLTQDALLQAMKRSIGASSPAGTPEALDCLCHGLDKAFNVWLNQTMVTRVMGSGRVPTYAPPFSPVGPVMGGTANMLPGGLA